MEKKNPNQDFNMDDEIKKAQEELIKEGKLEKVLLIQMNQLQKV